MPFAGGIKVDAEDRASMRQGGQQSANFRIPDAYGTDEFRSDNPTSVGAEARRRNNRAHNLSRGDKEPRPTYPVRFMGKAPRRFQRPL